MGRANAPAGTLHIRCNIVVCQHYSHCKPNQRVTYLNLALPTHCLQLFIPLHKSLKTNSSITLYGKEISVGTFSYLFATHTSHAKLLTLAWTSLYLWENGTNRYPKSALLTMGFVGWKEVSNNILTDTKCYVLEPEFVIWIEMSYSYAFHVFKCAETRKKVWETVLFPWQGWISYCSMGTSMPEWEWILRISLNGTVLTVLKYFSSVVYFAWHVSQTSIMGNCTFYVIFNGWWYVFKLEHDRGYWSICCLLRSYQHSPASVEAVLIAL